MGMVSPINAMTRGRDTSFTGAAPGRPKLLVVDDSSAVRDAIKLALNYGGYAACNAVCGDDARTLVDVEHPALLITDLNMPSGDGWDLIAFCHANHPQLPILIVSGDPRGTRPEIERHAQGFLPKPFGFRELLAEVARLLPANAELAPAR